MNSVGIEPTTIRLKVECSTAELRVPEFDFNFPFTRKIIIISTSDYAAVFAGDECGTGSKGDLKPSVTVALPHWLVFWPFPGGDIRHLEHPLLEWHFLM